MSLKTQQDWLSDSWIRSQESGLLESAIPDDYRLNHAGLEHKRHSHKQLIELVASHAVPLFNQLMAHTMSRLILSDRDGFVLSHWGVEKYSNKMTTVALDVGVNWLEQHKGTNAIGTALAARHAVSVVGAQHFLNQHRFMSCSACPIFSPSGELLAVLDITSEQQKHSQQTQLLVSSLVQQVETALLCQLPESHYRIDLAAQPDLIQSGWQGILVADSQGKLLGSNPMAKQMLKSAAVGDPIEQHLGEGWSAARSQSLLANLHLQTQAISQQQVQRNLLGTTIKGDADEHKQANQVEVRFLDDKLERAWQHANKVVRKGIPLLIFGETGVGKEQFVKKLHKQSKRHRGALVAVNCAAIPVDLVESELFGYQAGAFTGASKTGFIGKVRQADGGFLFLDEIGEMPLAAQGRLLRVLQEREVVPIGSNASHKVDIQVVAATHMDLLELIAQGRFRQDLYYRLNGLLVSLPALRDRLDIERIILKLHRRYRDQQQDINSALLSSLLEYNWPGNLRELDNLMQVACLMAEGETELQWKHLSDFQQQQLSGAGRAVSNQVTDSARPDKDGNNLEATADLNATIGKQVDAQIMLEFKACDGNVSACAKRLGVSRNTLYRKLKKLGIKS